jgi:hypothetical protein
MAYATVQDELDGESTTFHVLYEQRICDACAAAAAEAKRLANAPVTYFAEYICDGPEAAGHGCGASLGVHQINKDRFDELTGPKSSKFFEHDPTIAGWGGPAPQGRIVVVLQGQPCQYCRKI